jgi:glycine oxidase
MYDFLIIGQGIAGSILAYTLMKSGMKVYIIDDSPPRLLSRSLEKVARFKNENVILRHSDYLYPKLKKILGNEFKPKVIGGLITPVTGKRFTKTWMADTLLPFAARFYKMLEKELGQDFYTPIPIVRVFADARQANEWDVRSVDPSYEDYTSKNYTFENDQVNSVFGYTVFKHGAVVDGSKMLSAMHSYFKKAGVIRNCNFNAENLYTTEDFVQWEDIRAERIIFSEGWQAIKNPYFKWLPFMPAKGELLIVKSAGLKLKELINRGIFLRPLGHDLYLAGSTYTWDDLSSTPTTKGKQEIYSKLRSLIKSEFKVMEHLAGIRPTVKGRRPLIGKHPKNKNMFIFNGLGTKGLLLAPYFSQHMCQHLLENKSLLPEVDIKRFYQVS